MPAPDYKTTRKARMPEFSYQVDMLQLASIGHVFDVSANAKECVRLAARLGLAGLQPLKAKGSVSPVRQ